MTALLSRITIPIDEGSPTMWTPLALVAALSLAQQQPGRLALTNARTTYGAPGLPRTQTKLLPGDQLVVVFDIEGITIDSAGKVLYTTAVELADSKGKVLFKQQPHPQETVAALGGSSVPGMVVLDVGLDQPPGEYTVKVTVRDRASNRTGSLTRSFQVLRADFGIVRVTTTADPDGLFPTSLVQTGGSLWINTGVVNFDRDKDRGEPDVAVELRVLDEDGKPTTAEPFQRALNKKVPANVRFVPVQFPVALNRPGTFTVEIKATCRLSKKSDTLSLPIKVVASK
jgi:hypothetical protein